MTQQVSIMQVSMQEEGGVKMKALWSSTYSRLTVYRIQSINTACMLHLQYENGVSSYSLGVEMHSIFYYLWSHFLNM